ncbi:MAG TPA: SEFIR domain-containing protein [Pseudonocardiaceae bacterium]|jgi:hypothetical protein
MTVPHERSDDPQPVVEHPRVFVSYAHDSEDHKAQVVRFCHFLQQMGMDVRFDRWTESTRQDWSRWAAGEIAAADFVIVIASAAYRRRAEDIDSSDGRGVRWEAAILRELVTADRNAWFPKLLPVVLPGGRLTDIPLFLQPHSASRYVVTDLTVPGTEALLRTLTRQPRHVVPPIGPIVSLPAHRPDGTVAANPIKPERAITRYPGSVKLDVCRRLGDSWRELADVLEIPHHEWRRFPSGWEAAGVWEWLEMRDALGALRGALLRIDRPDLAHLLDGEDNDDTHDATPEARR